MTLLEGILSGLLVAVILAAVSRFWNPVRWRLRGGVGEGTWEILRVSGPQAFNVVFTGAGFEGTAPWFRTDAADWRAEGPPPSIHDFRKGEKDRIQMNESRPSFDMYWGQGRTRHSARVELFQGRNEVEIRRRDISRGRDVEHQLEKHQLRTFYPEY